MVAVKFYFGLSLHIFQHGSWLSLENVCDSWCLHQTGFSSAAVALQSKYSANFLKDERFTKTEYQTSTMLWKVNAEDTRITTWVRASKWGKLKQAPQGGANVCRRRRQRKSNLKKTNRGLFCMSMRELTWQRARDRWQRQWCIVVGAKLFTLKACLTLKW